MRPCDKSRGCAREEGCGEYLAARPESEIREQAVELALGAAEPDVALEAPAERHWHPRAFRRKIAWM